MREPPHTAMRPRTLKLSCATLRPDFTGHGHAGLAELADLHDDELRRLHDPRPQGARARGGAGDLPLEERHQEPAVRVRKRLRAFGTATGRLSPARLPRRNKVDGPDRRRLPGLPDADLYRSAHPAATHPGGVHRFDATVPRLRAG